MNPRFPLAGRRELAVFGGQPRFSEPLHVGRPNVGDQQRLFQRLEEMLDRGWLSNQGPFVVEFERLIAEMLGVRHCVAMCNGTVALEIAIRALGLSGEVIVPSFTFVATAHALQWQQIAPAFCDINPATHSVDPGRVEELITPRTSGIIGVHLWGTPCEIESLSEIAARRKLGLLFDAAHAFGCSYRGQMIGNFGDAEVLSFHATKFLNTFEGGAVVTNNDQLAKKMRLMKNFGFKGLDTVVHIGSNGKMTEVAAAMGLTNLESLDEFIHVNRRNYHCYQEGLAGLPGVTVLQQTTAEKRNYQYVVVEVDAEKAGLHRDELLRVLHAENVLARRYFYPGCHRMEPYRSHSPHSHLLLPETDRVAGRVLVLPTGTAVGPQEIAGICAVIRDALQDSRAVRWRLDDGRTAAAA
jgi:dTDP-4-amino-4,6-dideoxygalactose transaminase